MRHRMTGTFATFALPILLFIGVGAHAYGGQPGWTLVGWNDLGMHCMDDDFAVFSVLPPYNTIHAQLIGPGGNRITNPSGYTITYEAIPDPQGSINTSSAGKTNFWQFVASLFGVSPAPDEGLAGSHMPGSGNTPQPMHWESPFQWFTAEGIPITPYDDAGRKNYYPMMRLVARDASGTILATTDIVLPVSDEMDCRKCHGSNSSAAARPDDGWVNDPDPIRDYKLNILRIHDDHELGTGLFSSALSEAGYSPAGLEATQAGGTPILCSRCHGSNALPGTGVSGVPPFTQAVHGYHAYVTDPANGMALDASANRTACYSCHPGSDTRCLRGAMGHSVDASGELSMQCQSCHGSMTMVGSPDREGWFEEPTCQSCHTGTATQNAGQIRFTNSFSSPGVPRQPANNLFATNADTPAQGLSLFRFSVGHGGLQCEACHGSTHAIFPTSHEGDNIQSVQIQGSPGTLGDCAACHGTSPFTVSGGPHGMHAIGQRWIQDHHDATGGDDRASLKAISPSCSGCHGSDARGTVLSRSLTDKTVSTPWGTKHFWKGYQVGCYTCHNGPNSSSGSSNRPATVSNVSAATSVGSSVTINLRASDPDNDTFDLRIVTQPPHGRVGLSGSSATYYPDPGFSGADTFTYAAWDGKADSNLGQASVQVIGGGCNLECSATGPASVTVGQPASFSSSISTSGCSANPSFFWQLGDGSSSSSQNPTHTYSQPGKYHWELAVSLSGQTCRSSGTVVVETATNPCTLSCSADAPPAGVAGEPVTFQASAVSSDCNGEPMYRWAFGDGGTSTSRNPSHTFANEGIFEWMVTASLGEASCSSSGTITISQAGGDRSGDHRYITVAAHSQGRAYRRWRSDLAILNLNPHEATVRFSFRGVGVRLSQTLVFSPYETLEWRDVLQNLLGLENDDTGALTIDSDQRLLVSSRTYALQSGQKTIGQYFPAVEPSQGISAGATLVLPNLKMDDDFRTNLGFLNLSDISVQVRVRLYSSGGLPIGDVLDRTVPASGWLQINDVFEAANLGNTPLAWATVEVLSPEGTVWPYASLIDVHSGDPVTISPFSVP